MSDINNMSVTGHLTKDAEFRTLASGKGILTCSIANNSGFGDYQKTTFIKVQSWGNGGANIVNYLTKGTLIGATGTFEINEWNKTDGTKMIDLVLTTPSIQILSSRNRDREKPVEPKENDLTVF